MPFITNFGDGKTWSAGNPPILPVSQSDFVTYFNDAENWKATLWTCNDIVDISVSNTEIPCTPTSFATDIYYENSSYTSGTPGYGGKLWKAKEFWTCADSSSLEQVPLTLNIPCTPTNFVTAHPSSSLYNTNEFGTKLYSGDSTITERITGNLSALASSYTGVPQISQFGGIGTDSSLWSVANPKLVQEVSKFIKYNDYRSEKELPFRRIDGTSALTRAITSKSAVAGIYAAASVTPGGVYNVFNLDGAWKTGRGWGDHDNPNILRNDFTAMSNVNTKWRGGKWKPTLNPTELITPFTGDKVQVIDFGKRTLDQAYQWKPSRIDVDGKNPLNLTQDFIKFMFTGPSLRNGGDSKAKDDIIIFRAIIDSLEDSFNPNWSEQKMIGRADPNYIYNGVSRAINCQFKVYATTRDEMKPIWRKLNALAGYTAPTYNSGSMAMEAPWMRITIGDLFHQQAVVITSLSYNLHGSETTWEINVEKDPEMMEVPHYVSVNMQMNLITDALPEKGGRFYALTQMNNYDEDGLAKPGSNNWLSGVKNTTIINTYRYIQQLQEQINLNTPTSFDE